MKGEGKFLVDMIKFNEKKPPSNYLKNTRKEDVNETIDEIRERRRLFKNRGGRGQGNLVEFS